MRIGCLQFAPEVGEVDNNLSRADAILDENDSEDLDLDLLVLPELAFTGEVITTAHTRQDMTFLFTIYSIFWVKIIIMLS
jgi:predicted amidohydrolase